MDKRLSIGITLLLNSIMDGKQQVLGVKPVEGPQGRSGSLVEYFEVETDLEQIVVVRKKVDELERRVVGLLSDLHSAIPPTYIDKAHGQIYQIFVEELGFVADTQAPLFVSAAKGLAKIHAQNLHNRPDWLPLAVENPLESLALGNWRKQWELNQELPGFLDEFRKLRTALEEAELRLFEFMASNSYLKTSTLIMADILPNHIRIYNGEACYIDWGQARFGSLYLDLANVYDTRGALVYRDCLAAEEVHIEAAEFINSYKTALKYAGLRYLATGLRNWRDRKADWPAQEGFMQRCIGLALGDN